MTESDEPGIMSRAGASPSPKRMASPWPWDAAEISQHLAGRVHRQGPCLQADHAVGFDAA